MRRFLWILLPAAVAPLLLVLFFYAYVHGFEPHLSHRSADWASFGEYVGGTLSACYGFLAIMGVIATLRAQQSQSTLDEMQRLLASQAQRIDSILDSEPRHPDNKFRYQQSQTGAVHTVLDLLRYAGSATFAPTEEGDKYAEEQKLIETCIRQIKVEKLLLNIEFPQFIRLLQQYSRAEGSAIVVAHYEGKYALTIALMDGLGLLNSGTVREHFRRINTAISVCQGFELPADLAYTGRIERQRPPGP